MKERLVILIVKDTYLNAKKFNEKINYVKTNLIQKNKEQVHFASSLFHQHKFFRQ